MNCRQDWGGVGRHHGRTRCHASRRQDVGMLLLLRLVLLLLGEGGSLVELNLRAVIAGRHLTMRVDAGHVQLVLRCGIQACGRL